MREHHDIFPANSNKRRAPESDHDDDIVDHIDPIENFKDSDSLGTEVSAGQILDAEDSAPVGSASSAANDGSAIADGGSANDREKAKLQVHESANSAADDGSAKPDKAKLQVHESANSAAGGMSANDREKAKLQVHESANSAADGGSAMPDKAKLQVQGSANSAASGMSANDREKAKKYKQAELAFGKPAKP